METTRVYFNVPPLSISKEYPDICFYERFRKCHNCGTPIRTVELSGEYLDELIAWRDKAKKVKEILNG
jgi:hypothetical protein